MCGSNLDNYKTTRSQVNNKVCLGEVERVKLGNSVSPMSTIGLQPLNSLPIMFITSTLVVVQQMGLHSTIPLVSIP